jgi:4-hydroxythreonine-4-phosphate dehydrogenase
MLRIAVTPGEPAGIGPDLVVAIAQQAHYASLVAFADPSLLEERAEQLGLPLRIRIYDAEEKPRAADPGELLVYPVKKAADVVPGKTDPRNSAYVIDTLDKATEGCLSGEFDALLTAPVHKGIINEAGIAFSGHTEFLAAKCGAELPVMLLCTDNLKVALVTTHLALADVPAAITAERVEKVTRILSADLRRLFGIENPRIAILGLNPHAGESGHLGREEIDIIMPVAEKLRDEGFALEGPLPADSAFSRARLESSDAFLAMYHDQGLPVLKFSGFGEAINVTLGLPIIRTSVDHGTALELAGSRRADSSSIRNALHLACRLAAAQAG